MRSNVFLIFDSVKRNWRGCRITSCAENVLLMFFLTLCIPFLVSCDTTENPKSQWEQFVAFVPTGSLYVEPSFTANPLIKDPVKPLGLFAHPESPTVPRASHVLKFYEKLTSIDLPIDDPVMQDSWEMLEQQTIYAADLLARSGNLRHALTLVDKICYPAFDVMKTPCTAHAINNFAVHLAHAGHINEAKHLILDLIHKKKSQQPYLRGNLEWIKELEIIR